MLLGTLAFSVAVDAPNANTLMNMHIHMYMLRIVDRVCVSALSFLL